MNTGRVKYFNNDRGFGFIVDDATSTEYFVHFSAIVDDSMDRLPVGARVKFETQESRRRPGTAEACSVVVTTEGNKL